MRIDFFIQQFINSLSLGSLYALVAIGYTMIYAAIRVINFAHGDVMIWGAFISLIIMGLIFNWQEIEMNNVSFYTFSASNFLATLFVSLLGMLIYVLVYRPLLDKKAPRITMLIAAIAVSFFLESLFNVIANNLLGGSFQTFYFPRFFGIILYLGDATISITSLIIPIVVLVMVSILIYIMKTHKIGIAIRALSYDIEMVKLMGINTNLLISIIFFVSSAYAGVGGIFYAIEFPSIDPYMGIFLGLKAFAAAVIGGIGSIGGAVIGSFILGFVETMLPGFFPSLGVWKDAFAFILLIFILLFKPTGILGKDFERQRF